MSFRRITAEELHQQLASGTPPLVLDVRRREAFRKKPEGVPGAVPILLDEHPFRLPDPPHTQPIAVYCLCTGESSSARVAHWLTSEGRDQVSTLIGGLPAWEAAGYLTAPVDAAIRESQRWKSFDLDWAGIANRSTGGDPFVPLLVGQDVLNAVSLPLKRDMTVLFVDMVDSTPLLWRHSPEEVLRLVQTFMEIVTEAAIHHCGDVHDFQGDGALLYFAGPGEAVPATFRLREALRARRRELPELPLARFALDSGPLIVGLVGTAVRRSLSFIGPSINIAARILKLAPPGGIIATSAVVERASLTDPDLAEQFVAISESKELRGVPGRALTLFIAPP